MLIPQSSMMKSLFFSIHHLIILLSTSYFPGSVLGRTKMVNPQMRPKNINTNNRLDVIFLQSTYSFKVFDILFSTVIPNGLEISTSFQKIISFRPINSSYIDRLCGGKKIKF